MPVLRALAFLAGLGAACLMLPPPAVSLEFSNIACETTTTTGTGTVNLDGALSPYVGLIASGITTGAEVEYYITTGGGASRKIEVGRGVVTDASPDTMTRDPRITTDDQSDPITALTLAGTSTVCLHLSSRVASRPWRAGEFFWYTNSSCPAGSLAVDGSSLVRTTYPELFDEIGTTFGNVDASTFNLPDLETDDRYIRYGATVGTTGSSDVAAHTHGSITDRYVSTTNSNVDAGSNSRRNFSKTDTIGSSGTTESNPNFIDLQGCMVY